MILETPLRLLLSAVLCLFSGAEFQRHSITAQELADMGTLAIAYNKQKRFIEGRDACREAIALNPIDTGVRNTYAYALVHPGDQADGLREYRKILAQEPDNLSVQINVGAAYIAAGNYKAAIETPPRSVLRVLSRPEAS